MLASWFPWIHPILERQGKDGKDALWRTLGEGIAPETIHLAESFSSKYVYNPSQADLACSMYIAVCTLQYVHA